ncbi:MAG: glycosyltransferase [Lachnospiraceae bacterium]|nr:glycosyltransferase [Lachnospiraceae bacterium]
MSKTCFVDVVIPVYRPGRDGKLSAALKALAGQKNASARIILINTERKHFTQWARSEELSACFPGLVVRHIKKNAFDHAATRNMGAAHGDSPYILFMTMDAVPADDHLLERMIAGFDADDKCGAVYARQLAADDASPWERCAREFNYPEVSVTKTIDDEKRLGIKASFLSNVCAMYRRDVFEALGGFEAPAIFNEDMVFAHKLIHAGYHIRYEADARVYHSHNYSAGDQFHRNFDLGVSQAMHPEVFGNVRSEGEGIRYVKSTLSRLKESGEAIRIPGFLFVCAARYAGFAAGRNFRYLPRVFILRFTGNREFWKKWYC